MSPANFPPRAPCGLLCPLVLNYRFSLRMAIKGYKMPLEAKDLWSLNKRDRSEVMVPRLLREWEEEQAKAKRYGEQAVDEWVGQRRKDQFYKRTASIWPQVLSTDTELFILNEYSIIQPPKLCNSY